MVVIISNNVLVTIGEYTESLTKYPISSTRARQKVDKLILALKSLGSSIMTPPICRYKDLLQTFDKQGNPINKNLKRFNYKDESNFQWAFACLYDYENDTITILKMMPAISVRESLTIDLDIIVETMIRNYMYQQALLENNYIKIQNTMKQKIRLTEGDLHRIIRNCVNEALNELDYKTYLNAARKSYEPGPMFQTYDTADGSHKRNDRSRKFAQAAEDALNRDYGYEKTYASGNKGSLRFSTPHNMSDSVYDDAMGRHVTDKANFIAAKDYSDGGRLSDVGPRGGWGYRDHGYKLYDGPESSWGYHCGDKYLPKSDIYKGDKNFKNAINKAEQELNHYHKDDYDYEPNGRGWHLRR